MFLINDAIIFATLFQKLRLDKFIKKIIAFTLLVVFTIGIMPKKYLHDIFSHHTDKLFSQSQTGEKQITAIKYNCGFVNIAAANPFVHTLFLHQTETLRFFIPVKGGICPLHSIYFIPAYLLRGPPVA